MPIIRPSELLRVLTQTIESESKSAEETRRYGCTLIQIFWEDGKAQRVKLNNEISLKVSELN